MQNVNKDFTIFPRGLLTRNPWSENDILLYSNRLQFSWIHELEGRCRASQRYFNKFDRKGSCTQIWLKQTNLGELTAKNHLGDSVCNSSLEFGRISLYSWLLCSSLKMMYTFWTQHTWIIPRHHTCLYIHCLASRVFFVQLIAAKIVSPLPTWYAR